MWQIGMDALLLATERGYRGAGVSGYTWRLVRALARHDARHRYVVFAPKLPGAELPTFQHPAAWRTVALPRHALARVAFEQAALPLLAHGCHLLHAPVNVLPWNLPCPGVVTIHDLAFLRRPDVVSAARRRYLATMVRASARRAALVVAVSAATRRDVIEAFGVAPERVRVVFPSVPEEFRPGAGPAAGARPALLFLGTLEPRKNLATLLDAFALARSRGLGNVELILAGALDWEGGEHAATLRARIHRLKLDDAVRLPGYVDDAERLRLLQTARALVLPSWSEGFGLPAAEALACGTPVLAANTGSLPEVVGDAGELLPPEDPDAWAAAMQRAVEDDAWRAARSRIGLREAWRFSAAALARGMVAAYDAALLGYPAYLQERSADPPHLDGDGTRMARIGRMDTEGHG